MGCCGVIAEYNPFHNGHAYHLKETKARSGGARVIVAMSGSFTQRGDAAAFDKFTRAKWALENGADVVLELPTLFAMAHAERFAWGGVSLLSATGVVDCLSFGAEDANTGLLQQAALLSLNESEAFQSGLARGLARGLSFPSARAAALGGLAGETLPAGLFQKPNNILAIEYIKALQKINSAIRPISVARTGAGHDAPHAQRGFSSASALRNALCANDCEALAPYLPQGVYADATRLVEAKAAPISTEALGGLILYALRKMPSDALALLPDVAEGLENVFYAACRDCVSYDELLERVKTKRYTLARLRRVCISALLGISKADWAGNPSPRYIRVLGVRRDALGVLSSMAEKAALQIIISKSDCRTLSEPARSSLELDLFAGELLAMASPVPRPAEYEFARPLMILP